MQIKLEKQRTVILLTAEGRRTTRKILKKNEKGESSVKLLIQSLKSPHFQSVFVLLVLYRVFSSFQVFVSVYQVFILLVHSM